MQRQRAQALLSRFEFVNHNHTATSAHPNAAGGSLAETAVAKAIAQLGPPTYLGGKPNLYINQQLDRVGKMSDGDALAQALTYWRGSFINSSNMRNISQGKPAAPAFEHDYFMHTMTHILIDAVPTAPVIAHTYRSMPAWPLKVGDIHDQGLMAVALDLRGAKEYANSDIQGAQPLYEILDAPILKMTGLKIPSDEGITAGRFRYEGEDPAGIKLLRWIGMTATTASAMEFVNHNHTPTSAHPNPVGMTTVGELRGGRRVEADSEQSDFERYLYDSNGHSYGEPRPGTDEYRGEESLLFDAVGPQRGLVGKLRTDNIVKYDSSGRAKLLTIAAAKKLYGSTSEEVHDTVLRQHGVRVHTHTLNESLAIAQALDEFTKAFPRALEGHQLRLIRTTNRVELGEATTSSVEPRWMFNESEPLLPVIVRIGRGSRSDADPASPLDGNMPASFAFKDSDGGLTSIEQRRYIYGTTVHELSHVRDHLAGAKQTPLNGVPIGKRYPSSYARLARQQGNIAEMRAEQFAQAWLFKSPRGGETPAGGAADKRFGGLDDRWGAEELTASGAAVVVYTIRDNFTAKSAVIRYAAVKPEEEFVTTQVIELINRNHTPTSAHPNAVAFSPLVGNLALIRERDKDGKAVMLTPAAANKRYGSTVPEVAAYLHEHFNMTLDDQGWSGTGVHAKGLVAHAQAVAQAVDEFHTAFPELLGSSIHPFTRIEFSAQSIGTAATTIEKYFTDAGSPIVMSVGITPWSKWDNVPMRSSLTVPNKYAVGSGSRVNTRKLIYGVMIHELSHVRDMQQGVAGGEHVIENPAAQSGVRAFDVTSYKSPSAYGSRGTMGYDADEHRAELFAQKWLFDRDPVSKVAA